MSGDSSERNPTETPAEEADRYRALERAWQDEVGYALLDKPYEAQGSEAVFMRQWDRLIRRLDGQAPGVLIEIGCGRGHFLRRLLDTAKRPPRALVGLDLSRAVSSLPERGLLGVQADGEFLPFRDGCADAVIYDGSLHHAIDYPHALREAIRVLGPDGMLLIFEPLSSRFSQLAHRLLDPIIFRKVVYESPIDIRYKKDFHVGRIVEVLRENDMSWELERSDFLAYPFTGCYASSVFSRSLPFMRAMMVLEDRIAAVPGLNRIAEALAWRFTIVARKAAAAEPRGA